MTTTELLALAGLAIGGFYVIVKLIELVVWITGYEEEEPE